MSSDGEISENESSDSGDSGSMRIPTGETSDEESPDSKQEYSDEENLDEINEKLSRLSCPSSEEQAGPPGASSVASQSSQGQVVPPGLSSDAVPQSLDARSNEGFRICIMGVRSLDYGGVKINGVIKGEAKLLSLLFEMHSRQIDVMCVTNHRWTENGSFQYTYHTPERKENYRIFYNNGNKDKHYAGVAIIMSERLHQYEPNVVYNIPDGDRTSHRIIHVKFNCFDIIALCAPTVEEGDEEKLTFEDELRRAFEQSSENLVLLGNVSNWKGRKSLKCWNDEKMQCWFRERYNHIYGKGILCKERKAIPTFEAPFGMIKQPLKTSDEKAPLHFNLKDGEKSILHGLLLKSYDEVKEISDNHLKDITKPLKRKERKV